LLTVALDALPDQAAHHATRSPLLAIPGPSTREAEGWIVRKGNALMTTTKPSMPQTRQSDDNPTQSRQPGEWPVPRTPGVTPTADADDYHTLYCAVQRDRARYELVCDSIRCDLAEQLTAHGRRVCAAKYKAAVDRLLAEVEADTFGGAA
jgi:hypothetical protein